MSFIRRVVKYSLLKKVVPIVLVAVLLFTLSGTTLAQGGIGYGSSVFGSLTTEAPLAFYTFNGNAGDLVMAYAVGITPDMAPSISLLAPNQQQLASNDRDPFGLGMPGEARISYRLPETGLYSLLVSNANGTPGDFLVRLSGGPSAASTGLQPGVPTLVNIPPGAPSQTYSFNASPTGSTELLLSTDSPGFAFAAQVRDASGQLITVLAGNSLQAASLMVGPGEGLYEVVVTALSPELQGAVQIALGAGAGSSSGAGPAPASPTQMQPPSAAAPQGVCSVNSFGNVNVRSGPGTNYGIIGSLAPGNFLTVTGRNGDGSWYAVNYAGLQGWVAMSVVNMNGPCGSVPVVQTPPPPAGPPPPQPPASTEEVTSGSGSPTYTPTYTPTTETGTGPTYTPTTPPPPSPTYTPTEQIAPPDGNSNGVLAVPLDGQDQKSDYVSYPNGDTEDVVSYRVDGLNNNVAFSGGQANLSIQLICNGTGDVTFIVDGQNYACGQTFTRVVNADSNTGAVRIRATSNGTYMQWTVIGSAPRTN